MFTLYSADVTGNPGNCSYPHRHVILDGKSLKEAVSHDYVCAEYRNSYRSGGNFLGSDCLPVDCDNDHTEDPSGWVTPADVMEAFPGVSFAVHYSRYNNREKKGRAPRPKFHILFPIARVTDAALYSEMKKAVSEIFPYFDTNALDAARFFFGTEEAEVSLCPGRMDLTEFLSGADMDDGFADMPDGIYGGLTDIPEGQRNSTLSRFAGRVLKKYGDTEEALKAFEEKAALCSPPLEDQELRQIWNSALKFYRKISREDGYVPPDVYNDPESYKPMDYSDVGQAEILAKYFSGELRYSPATHFIRYSDRYWQETEPGAQAVAHELTRRQMREAERDMAKALGEMERNGAATILASAPKNRAEQLMNDVQLRSYRELQDAKAYRQFVVKWRDSRAITSTLKEARPMLEIDPAELDADCFALNTPAGVYDLRKGLEGLRPHRQDDYMTKITAVSPGNRGEAIWSDCLATIFGTDEELIRYVQMICGLAAIGKVFVESLIIAYGDGRNGKSTFWNAVSRVLGLYSGNISADTLTVGCRRNVKPELAETKGKRLLIAAEMQEGARLNGSTVKQLCSTDDIFAEKKYKDPFSFKPCHTLVLYTNHLPKVGATDDGIWRRLTVIPFCAKIEGSSDKKNYAEYLFDNAGEAILAWIIEGARKVIERSYRLPVPACVRDAVAEYRNRYDWFTHFVEDRCETGEGLSEKSADLYQTYRNYCLDMNEYVRSTADFYAELENRGFERIQKNRVKYFKGLRIRQEKDAGVEFL